ncbi:MAG: hypothetical protein SH847_21255 [Roseiflexaceae bacterium]|nr:hypothetical protein [Roseiflexaceae bacterium]
MPQQLEISYRASGGRMPVDIDLQLRPDGQAELFVGSSWSLPSKSLTRVGFFGGSAPATELAALRSFLADNNLHAHAGSYGQPSPDAINRALKIVADGQATEITIKGTLTDQTVNQFEDLLLALALKLTDQPLRAAEAKLDAQRTNDQFVGHVTLTTLGTQPWMLLLVDSTNPATIMRSQLELSKKVPQVGGGYAAIPFKTAVLPLDQISALVTSGVLPGGATSIQPGTSFQIPLPDPTLPTGTALVAAARLTFWYPDGNNRRQLIVLTPEIQLP